MRRSRRGRRIPRASTVLDDAHNHIGRGGNAFFGDEEVQLAHVRRSKAREQALCRDDVLKEVDVAIEMEAWVPARILPIATIAAKSRSSPLRTVVIGAPWRRSVTASVRSVNGIAWKSIRSSSPAVCEKRRPSPLPSLPPRRGALDRTPRERAPPRRFAPARSQGPRRGSPAIEQCRQFVPVRTGEDVLPSISAKVLVPAAPGRLHPGRVKLPNACRVSPSPDARHRASRTRLRIAPRATIARRKRAGTQPSRHARAAGCSSGADPGWCRAGARIIH